MSDKWEIEVFLFSRGRSFPLNRHWTFDLSKPGSYLFRQLHKDGKLLYIGICKAGITTKIGKCPFPVLRVCQTPYGFTTAALLLSNI